MSYLLFPNQLFELKYFPQDNKPRIVYLLEEPVYFGFRDIKLNFNKLKLVLHRASMKYYESYLKKNNILVHYLEFNDLIKLKTYKQLIKNNDKDDSDILSTFDLTDHYLEKKVLKSFPSIKFQHNPNFLVSQEQLNQYYQSNKSKKTIVHGHFYNWVKEQIDILTETKSYDTENRNPLPDNVKIPSIGGLKPTDKKFINEAIKYVIDNFPNNCGPSELNIKNCWFPITHSGSKQWLQKFIKERLNNFGTYQDAIRNDNPFMFHSLIAPMFNIGLLSPHQIIDEVMKEKSKENIEINNIEGFLRQIIGWREYQRYCYLHYYQPMTTANIFKNDRKLDVSLYEGTTGVPPVDDAIKNAFENGYLHHIQRLMVISNFFNLIDLEPHQSYIWFMEFSLDSYDWLMTQNIYSMGMWADGGLTMRKPYISTAGYILNMSNYKEPKESKETETKWTDVWKALFYYKISRHPDIFRKTPYIFQLKGWEKMNKGTQDDLTRTAVKFIKDHTK